MTDETKPQDGESTGAGSDGSAGTRQAEWIRDLQAMIDNVATQAGPALRDVAAKAGELAEKASVAAAPYAGKAAAKAAPYAARAADLTAEVGRLVSEKSREVAAEIRRSSGEAPDPATANGSAESPDAPIGTVGQEDDVENGTGSA